jgi:hypothetical protein
MSEDRKAEDRIDAYMAGRLGDLAQSYRWLDAWSSANGRTAEDRAEDARTRIDELPLSVEIRRVIRVTFGTGGPEDYLEAEIDRDGDIIGPVRYVFRDWWDRAEREPGGELRKAAARMLSEYAEIADTD